MYKYISASSSVNLPDFSLANWDFYLDEGDDGKFYSYYDEASDISFELVKMPDGWNGNVDGEPLVADPRQPLYSSPQEAIRALKKLYARLY